MALDTSTAIVYIPLGVASVSLYTVLVTALVLHIVQVYTLSKSQKQTNEENEPREARPLENWQRLRLRKIWAVAKVI